MSDRLLVLTELSLVDGPIELPDLAYSFADDWKSELYTPEEIAAAIAGVPNVHVVHGGHWGHPVSEGFQIDHLGPPTFCDVAREPLPNPWEHPGPEHPGPTSF